MANFLKKYTGFTIMELMTVLVIIGLLAWLVIPASGMYMERTRDTERAQSLHNISLGIKNFYRDMNQYPSKNINDTCVPEIVVDWMTPKTIPTSPSGNQYNEWCGDNWKFWYQVWPNYLSYALQANMEWAKRGNNDDTNPLANFSTQGTINWEIKEKAGKHYIIAETFEDNVILTSAPSNTNITSPSNPTITPPSTPTSPTCTATQVLHNGTCKPKEQACTSLPTNATQGVQKWTGSGYGSCEVTMCKSGFHKEGNACVTNTKFCTVANGIGKQTWANNAWWVCVPTSCNSGYELKNGKCERKTENSFCDSWFNYPFQVSLVIVCPCKAQTIDGYDIPKIEHGKRSNLITKIIPGIPVNGHTKYSAQFSCNNGTISKISETSNIQCNNGYENKNGKCESHAPIGKWLRLSRQLSWVYNPTIYPILPLKKDLSIRFKNLQNINPEELKIHSDTFNGGIGFEIHRTQNTNTRLLKHNGLSFEYEIYNTKTNQIVKSDTVYAHLSIDNSWIISFDESVDHDVAYSNTIRQFKTYPWTSIPLKINGWDYIDLWSDDTYDWTTNTTCYGWWLSWWGINISTYNWEIIHIGYFYSACSF